MKKFISMLLLTVFALFAYAADYRVLVLGDLHYDAPEYHQVPNVKTTFRLRSDYIKMWKEKTPALLSAAAKQLGSDVPFIIQCGDFTQGDGVGGANQEKMFTDAFAKVKSFFPKHKLLPVKGNHDIRTFAVDLKNNKLLKRQNTNVHTDKAFTPFAAKELGAPVKDHYTVVHNNDLYIFYDGFRNAKSSINFVKKTLAANAKARNVFFITHLPIIPCSKGDPGWLLPGYKELAKLLLSRNAVIFTAHTHQPSVIKINDGKNTLTQLVTSSIGYAWHLGQAPQHTVKNVEEFTGKLTSKAAKRKRGITAAAFLKSLKVESFEMFDRNANGFTIVKVSDDGVTAEFYNNDSGKPALVKKLK